MGGLSGFARRQPTRLFRVADHRHPRVALHESTGRERWLVQHFDMAEAFHDFLPEDLQLQFGQTVADAAVDTEAERDVPTGIFAIDDEIIRTVPEPFVSARKMRPPCSESVFATTLPSACSARARNSSSAKA